MPWYEEKIGRSFDDCVLSVDKIYSRSSFNAFYVYATS